MIGIQHIVLAMKPTDGNFAYNAMKHGVAGINVDGCRIETNGDSPKACKAPGWDSINKANAGQGYRANEYQQGGAEYVPNPEGRFPSNVILQESAEIIGGFPESNSTRVSGNPNNPYHGTNHNPTSYGKGDGTESNDYRDSGSASRFFKQVQEE